MIPDLLFLVTLSQTDAPVADESASDSNGDLQKFIAAKQLKKVEEINSKLIMAVNANKRAVDRLEEFFVSDLKKKKKKKKKKNAVLAKFEKRSNLSCAYLVLWVHS